MSPRCVAALVFFAVTAVAPGAGAEEPRARTAVGAGGEVGVGGLSAGLRFFVLRRIFPVVSMGVEVNHSWYDVSPTLLLPRSGNTSIVTARRGGRLMALFTFHLLETHWSERGGAAITLETGLGVVGTYDRIATAVDGRYSEPESGSIVPRLAAEIAPGFHLVSEPFSWDLHFGAYVWRGPRTLDGPTPIEDRPAPTSVIPLILRLGMQVRF